MARFSSARLLAVALATSVAGATAPPARGEHPNALWRVVHDLCVLDKRVIGAPAPCVAVDLAHGWAVVKDPNRPTQLLLVPTRRIAGIESPELLAPGAPNYWQAAWEARRWLELRVDRPVPRDAVGLAVNAIAGRSQNQLHIHIDCIRADVRQALAGGADAIGSGWAPLDFDLAGRRYRARWIEGLDFGARDPFKLLAADPQARADMGRETLVAIGAARADGAPGFVLLSGRSDWAKGERGAGEDLLDHGCEVLNRPSPHEGPAAH